MRQDEHDHLTLNPAPAVTVKDRMDAAVTIMESLLDGLVRDVDEALLLCTMLEVP